jgi:AcrR family transcriptional regulator
VTRETRERTRARLIAAARERFRTDGYEAATTRAIAADAGIATGTLFNYFPSKEALALALVGEATARAEEELDSTRRPEATLEEDLFAHVAVQLRHLEPYRGWVAEVLESGLNPLRAHPPEGASDLRQRHLERVERWIAEAVGARAESALDLHLYWSLYLGVVSSWSRDDSEHQEATLALLDRSMGLFCRALREGSERER